MNIQAPNIISLELVSQTTLSRKIAKCFAFKASYLLVFLLNYVVDVKLIYYPEILFYAPDIEAGNCKTQETEDN